MEALVKPFPSELTTPPVTKMYFVMERYCTGKRADKQSRKRKRKERRTQVRRFECFVF